LKDVQPSCCVPLTFKVSIPESNNQSYAATIVSSPLGQKPVLVDSVQEGVYDVSNLVCMFFADKIEVVCTPNPPHRCVGQCGCHSFDSATMCTLGPTNKQHRLFQRL
jgi:hypothetical protein